MKLSNYVAFLIGGSSNVYSYRAMVSQLTAAGNHCHFARLFQKQLVQVSRDASFLHVPCTVGVHTFTVFLAVDVQRPPGPQLSRWCSGCRSAGHGGSRQPGEAEAPARASDPATGSNWPVPSTLFPWTPGVLQRFPTDSQLVKLHILLFSFLSCPMKLLNLCIIASLSLWHI